MNTKWQKNRVEAALFLSGKGIRVLDIGCGDGQLLVNLKDNYSQLFGAEISIDNCKRTSKKLESINAKIINANFEEKTSFNSDYFDLIISCDVIEHIFDIFNFFSEIYRVLEPGGNLITITPNIAYFKRRITLLSGKFPSTSASDEGFGFNNGTSIFDGGHIHYFTFRMIKKIYLKYGFKNIRLWETWSFP